MNPNCVTYVGDASPSMVACRITECLKKRSILAEYDDESATVNAWTAERVSFTISLYRGAKKNSHHASQSLSSVHLNMNLNNTNINTNRSTERSVTSISTSNTSCPDFSHGVLVECFRNKGDVITFHRHCQAVLSSAHGDSDGLDDIRKPLSVMLQSPYGFGRNYYFNNQNQYGEHDDRKQQDSSSPNDSESILPNLVQLPWKAPSTVTRTTCIMLEKVLELLEKDRMDAQKLGMQSLFLLTDLHSSALETAYMCSLCVLGSPMRISSSKTPRKNDMVNASLERIHEILITTIHGPEDNINQQFDTKEYASFTTSERKRSDLAKDDMSEMVLNHQSSLRTSALQILTNALYMIVHHSHKFPLLPKPTCEDMSSYIFLQKVADDLKGASRPPTTSLGTAHEATIAARFLHLFALYLKKDVCNILGNLNIGDFGIMEYLKRAKSAGLSSHLALSTAIDNTRAVIAGESS
jgi:hypothetical protein